MEKYLDVQNDLLDVKKKADLLEDYIMTMENAGIVSYKRYTLLSLEYHTLRTLQFILQQRLECWEF